MIQKYASYDSNGAVTGFYDDVDSPVPSNTPAIKVSDAEWQDALNNPGKYTVINGVFTAASPWPPAPTVSERWAAYQMAALAKLAASDVTMSRVAEGVALGNTSWTAPDVVAYAQMRASLRAILSQQQPASIPSALPDAPYPAGT